MKNIFVTAVIQFCLLVTSLFSFSQDIPVPIQLHLEQQADADQTETEDDAYLLELEHFLKNPVNLNRADVDEIRQLRIVSDLQVANLLSYRKLFGPLLNVYELQAVPSWDIATIRKALPWITVNMPSSLTGSLAERFRGGDQNIVIRVTQILEKSKGYEKKNGQPSYLGSPQRWFLRYRYNYKNVLQFGMVGDKDAGEQFFRGVQRTGFDFYSFHFFIKRIGAIKALALGDFTVSMGQGLIHWQGLAFRKSASVTSIKRQAPVLQPHSSAGEFFFHRGAGITIYKRKFECSLFASIRKLSAHTDMDTSTSNEHITSFLTSGNHRTHGERASRNLVGQKAMGGSVRYIRNKWHVGMNGILYRFSFPLQKRDEPYNVFAASGRQWHNLSMDYSFTYRNLHVFGESAVDKNGNRAVIHGLLASIDPKIDFSVIYRSVSASYQAINGNAFTENFNPSNENGFYAGFTLRPATVWRIDAYVDLYVFPWLKYLIDAPSHGHDYLVQVSYLPSKQVEVYTRFRRETKQTHADASPRSVNELVSIQKSAWRTHVGYKLNSSFTIRNRVELLWLRQDVDRVETGFLSFIDIIYKPQLRPFSAAVRAQFFETNGFSTRIYAYENDILYSYSVPAFFDRGFRYYAILQLDLSKKLSFWVRWAQTIYKDKISMGTGLDEIPGNLKTEVKIQASWLF